MYPNQNNPRSAAPYPQQPAYNVAGAHPQQQQQQQPSYGQPSSYGSGGSLPSGYQQNMSAPYGGNPGMFGGIGSPYPPGSNPQGGTPYTQNPNPQGGNPYTQNPNPQGGNHYTQNPNPQGGNPYAQSGYGMSSGSTGAGGYPPPGQQPYGSTPYNQNTGAPGTGYPPTSGGYPPHSGGYPPQSGGYPPPSGAYSGQQLPYSSQGSYPGSQPGGGFGGPGSQPGGGFGGPGNQPGGGFGGPGMGAGAGGFMSNDQRNQRMNQVIQQYEVNPQFAARLQALGNCEIVILCDDSGSMNTQLQGSNQTRWDELKSIVNIVIDIASTMDSNGVDVYFLNRDPIANVTNIQNMRHVFNSPPQGLTPLVPALRRILAAKRSQALEKKLLILIATDGAPTNEQGQQDVGALEAVLRHERTPQTYVSFMACTDDLNAVNYLSNWDKTMPNLDVMDDYRSERAEIQRTRGQNFPFSFGDYIVKTLLGSLDPWFDALDERA